MQATTTRHNLTLPSGGTCVVRALSALDLGKMPIKPAAFPNPERFKEVAAEGSLESLTDVEIGNVAKVMEFILLSENRICSPITWGNDRRRVVSNKDLDEVCDDEITVEELPQADADAIVGKVFELGSMTKEAGQSLGTFPQGQEIPSDGASDS